MFTLDPALNLMLLTCNTSQALSTFARHMAMPESVVDAPDGASEERSDDDSSSPSIRAMRRSESNSANRSQVRRLQNHNGLARPAAS